MTVVDPITGSPPDRSRRQVLCGLVVGLLAPGALAACGGTTSNGSTTTAPAGTAGPGSRQPGTGALAAVSDVPTGGGLVVDGPNGGKVLLVRPAAGQVKAFDAACPHMGTTVDAPAGGTITCPNHRSQFDAATGALRRGPASTGLKEIPVRVDGGAIMLA